MKIKNSEQSRTLTIMFESLDDFKARALDIAKKKTKFIQPINHILFENVPLYYRFMTAQKYELLTLILQKKPESVFQLAQMVERDYGAVSRDCRAMAILGFIKLQDIQDNRNTKRPVLAFDYNKIVVRFPNSIFLCQLDFFEAA